MLELPLTTAIVEEHAEAFAGSFVVLVHHDLSDIRLLARLLDAAAGGFCFVPIKYAAAKSQTDARDGTVADAFVTAIRQAVEKAEASDMPWLVVEDGARFWDAARGTAHLALAGTSRLVGVVEQTTAGERLALKRLARGEPYPMTISLARSRAKTQIENHFVAERIWEESSLLLAETGRFLQYQLVLLVGYGILGRSVAHKFRARGCRVVVYDVRADCRAAALAEGFPVAERPAQWPRDASVVVGVTGNDSVDPGYCLEAMASHREPLVLVSGSSRRKEFAGVIATLEAMDVNVGAYPWGRRYTLAGAERGGIDLIADGLPVNFFRHGSDSLANRMSDLVLGELTLCAAWALNGSRSHGPGALLRFGRTDVLAVGRESEAAVIDRWCALNGITQEAATTGGNPAIGPHPYECHIVSDETVEADLAA